MAESGLSSEGDWQLPADQRRKARDKQGGGHGHGCLLRNKPICWKTICFKKCTFHSMCPEEGHSIPRSKARFRHVTPETVLS